MSDILLIIHPHAFMHLFMSTLKMLLDALHAKIDPQRQKALEVLGQDDFSSSNNYIRDRSLQ